MCISQKIISHLYHIVFFERNDKQFVKFALKFVLWESDIFLFISKFISDEKSMEQK